MKLIEGKFFEGETIVAEFDGKRIKRKVRYNRMDGLYIVYRNMKYFCYECDFSEYYKRKERKS